MSSTTRQLRQCADAIAAEINSQTWDQPLRAVRKNRPLFNLTELIALACTVMPVSRVTDVSSRQDDQITLRVDVGLQQKFANADVDNVDSDPLIDLGEELCEHFARRTLTGADGTSAYQCLRTVYGDEDSPFMDLDHANSHEVFTGVVSLYLVTFREVDNT